MSSTFWIVLFYISVIFIIQPIECRLPIEISLWIKQFTLLLFQIWLQHSVENQVVNSVIDFIELHWCTNANVCIGLNWDNDVTQQKDSNDNAKCELNWNDYCIEYNNIVTQNFNVNVNWLRALCHSNRN